MREITLELTDDVYKELLSGASSKNRSIYKEAARRIEVCPFLEERFRELEEWLKREEKRR